MSKKQQLTGSDIVMKCLEEEGVRVVFGMPGGVLIPMYDAMTRYAMQHVLIRHEQGGAFAADGYARASGNVGVAIGTSGPGATNLVTGIANAMADSVPVVYITGQVPGPLIGMDAFQETDISGVTLPLVKQSYLVECAKDLLRVFKESFHIARHGRPGPVHIDIPKDVFMATVDGFTYPNSVDLPGLKDNEQEYTQEDITRAAELIASSERPLVLVGHGVQLSGAERPLKTFVEMLGVPAVSTLLGLGSLPDSHPLHLGFTGMHGSVFANYAMANADLIINVGSRFDDRITGTVATFIKNKKFIHIDIDPSEIGKVLVPDVALVGDARRVLDDLNIVARPKVIKAWWKQINAWKRSYPLATKESMVAKRKSKSGRPTMPECMNALCRVANEDAYIVSDVGQHQMWVAQHYFFEHPRRHLSAGGLGPMGYGMPAAMGARFAAPDKEVWAVVGDGGFQMNIQELGTLADYQIAIKILVVNNGYLGMVRQWQDLFYDKNYSAVKINNPDFVMLAKSYGIPAVRVGKADELDNAMYKAKKAEGPFIVELMVPEEENCYPMVAAGTALKDVIPDPKHAKKADVEDRSEDA